MSMAATPEHEADAPPLAAVIGAGARRPVAADERRAQAEWRLALVAAAFCMAFVAVALRMGALALSEPAEPRVAAAAAEAHVSRAEILDRAGRPLAMNLPAWSAYAHPREIDDIDRAARRLAEALPGLDEAALRERLGRGRLFEWIRRPITPEQRQAIHDSGVPGVYFGAREARVYPAGRMAAHILGGVRAGEEGVAGAEIFGLSGVERSRDEALRDPAREGAPLRLSIDLSAQAALTEVLEAGMRRLGARGAAATLMDARTGAILAMVSLPDFDPNARPDPNDPAVARAAPLRNRAVEGVYEFGSVAKPLFAALALERGLVDMTTMIDAKGPIFWGRSRFKDDYPMPPEMTVADAMARSSNVVAIRLALMAGTPAAQDFLERLGMTRPVPLDLPEARLGQPLAPRRWSDLSTITMSFGYGLSVTQLHLAVAYAALVNGGFLVTPTLDPDAAPPGESARVLSARTSAAMRAVLRATVERGTGRSAEAPGYEVGGKTGTANKLSETGRGYADDRTMATFAAAFPMSDPAYVLLVTLDEPVDRSGPRPRRTAGATVAPITGEAIRRLAPLLGLRPARPATPVTLAARG